jgi:hypothetical protein
MTDRNLKPPYFGPDAHSYNLHLQAGEPGAGRPGIRIVSAAIGCWLWCQPEENWTLEAVAQSFHCPVEMVRQAVEADGNLYIHSDGQISEDGD